MSSRGGTARRPAAARRGVVAPRWAATAARWLAAHEHVSAGLLFGAFVLVYLWPVLVGGDLLSPRGVFFQAAPWAASAPAGWQRSANFILGDVPITYYPFHVLARQFFEHGVFPAWSQHAYAGVPFFANVQTIVISPFALPIWLLSLEFGIAVSAALKLWVAAFGTYLLVRELRLSFWPGVLAGISFALSAWGVLWLTHETLLEVAAILPWSLWLVERIARGGGLGPAIGLALAFFVILTGGHPGTQAHVSFATALYALVRLANVPDVARRERIRRGALVAGGVAVGVLLTAVLLVPFMQASAHTIGVRARVGQNNTIPGSQLPFGAIRTAFFPDWWGRPSDLSLDGPANYNERTYYAGGVATLLALIALVSPGGWRRKAPFALLAFVGLAVPLHAPGFFWLGTHLPLLRGVQFQRMLLLYVFAATVLGAFGLQRLIDAPRERRRALIVLGAAAAAGVLAFLTASLSGADLRLAAGNILHLRHALGSGLTNEEAVYAGRFIATTVGWWLVVVAIVAALLAAFWRWPRRRRAIVVGLVLFAALDVLYFAHDYQPMAPASKIGLRRTPAIAYLQRHANEGRIGAIGFALPNDWTAIYGLRDVRGGDQPQPSERWFHLWQTYVYPEQPNWSQSILPSPSASGLKVLSVMGGRYIAAEPDTTANAESPLKTGYRGSDARVFVNPNALPRALVAPHVVVTSGEHGTIEAIGEEGFEPRRDVTVESSEPGAAALAHTSGAGGSVAVTSETDTTVTLDATLRQPGLVLLDDALAPGWSVRVDDVPATVVRADDVMRGVAVPAGSHRIVWSYRVPGLGLGLGLSGIGLLALLAMCAVWWTRRRSHAALGA